MARRGRCLGSALVWWSCDASLRELCPNPHYEVSTQRRYEWHSVDLGEQWSHASFPIDGLRSEIRMLEIGGPTPWAESVYGMAARVDNIVQRNHFARTGQMDVGKGASREFYGVDQNDLEGLPFAPLAGQPSLGTTYQRHGAQLDGIADESYRVVFTSHVLEHFLDPLGALREWHRVLEPGGVLILVVPWAPAVSYDAHRDPSTMQALLHLSALNASFNDDVLRSRAEAFLKSMDGKPNFNPDIFTLCDGDDAKARDDVATAAATRNCRVDENHAHWHVWDFDLLREAVEGCLGYTMLMMLLQEPWHQIIAGKKPFAPRQVVEAPRNDDTWANATVARVHRSNRTYDLIFHDDGTYVAAPERLIRCSGRGVFRR